MDRQDRVRHARALLNEIQSRLDKAEHTNSTVADLMATLQLVIESLEDSDEQLQQYYNRSLVHQNLLEERLLAVEKNRLFQFWNRLVSMLPRPLYHLIHDRSPGVRQSAKSYAQWVSHEQAQLPSFDEHRAVSQHWRYRSEENTSELQSHSFISYAVFFFNHPATTEIYTLSLHDALPI